MAKDKNVNSESSENDLVTHMTESLNKAVKQYNLVFKLDKSYESKPPNINKVETNMITVNFYHLKDDKGHYLIKDLYFLVNICTSQIKISLMLLRMIKIMRSNHEPGVDGLLNDVNYVLCKVLDYNLKLKDKLYDFKTEVTTKFKLKKFGLTDIQKVKLDKFSDYIKNLDEVRRDLIGVTEEQSYHTNKSIEMIGSIIQNYDVNQENKELKADRLSRKIVFYASSNYEIEQMIYMGIEIAKLRKIVTSGIEEVFAELDGGVGKENEKDNSAKKLDFEQTLKEEIKLKISESSEYKGLQIMIIDSTSKAKLLNEGEKKAENAKKQISRIKSQLKSRIEKIANKDVDDICKTYEIHLKTVMKELTNDLYVAIMDIVNYCYRIERLFTIFDKFTDYIPENYDKYSYILKEKICVICLEYVKTDIPLRYVRLKCGHYYHKVCYETFFVDCCHSSIYDLKKPGYTYRDENKASLETYNHIIKKNNLDYVSVRMLVVEFNLILCGLVMRLKTLNTRTRKIKRLIEDLSKQNKDGDKLSFTFILNSLYEAERKSIISPLNDLKRLIFITFEQCRLQHLELNENYI